MMVALTLQEQGTKIQKLEPCRFNKHLFLKKLFEFRSSLQEISSKFMFSEAATRGVP